MSTYTASHSPSHLPGESRLAELTRPDQNYRRISVHQPVQRRLDRPSQHPCKCNSMHTICMVEQKHTKRTARLYGMGYGPIYCSLLLIAIVFWRMKSSRSRQALPLGARRALAKQGLDISAARRRRRLSTALMSERAFISRNTLARVERLTPVCPWASMPRSSSS